MARPVGTSHPSDLRDHYVRWASSCEQRLGSVIVRTDVLKMFENPRHRDICSMPPGNQMSNLISDEITAKSADFAEIRDSLKAARDRMSRGRGCPAVLDTNVLLQCLLPDQIRWASVIGESARLMLPLRVIEELDAKKYTGTQRVRDVARGLVPWLEGLFPGSDCGPVPVGDPDATTMEVLLADRPRYRPMDADEEVLDVYYEVKLLAGRAKLVTADGGMRLRARAEGVELCFVPMEYRRQ